MAYSAETRQCSHCKSARVYPSRCRRKLETVLSFFGGDVCRCHGCFRRQVWFGMSSIRISEGDDASPVAGAVVVATGTLAFISSAVIFALRYHR
jgi:hypothetical protein